MAWCYDMSLSTVAVKGGDCEVDLTCHATIHFGHITYFVSFFFCSCLLIATSQV